MSVLPSPWKMKRDEMLQEPEGYGITAHPKWTVPELRQKVIEQREVRYPKQESKVSGFSKLTLAALTEKAKEVGLELYRRSQLGD